MGFFAFLIGNPFGQVLSCLAVFASLWWGFTTTYEHKGAAKLIAKQEVIANAKVEKANKAARSVAGVPDSGLRDRFFRD